MGKEEEPRRDLGILMKGEGETLIEEGPPALPIEKKPPAKFTETSPVKEEKPDEKKTIVSTLKPESKSRGTRTGKRILQLGAFREKTTAEDLKRRLTDKGYDAYLEEVEVKDKGILYRVRARCCSNAVEARAVKARFKKQGFGDSFLVSRKTN